VPGLPGPLLRVIDCVRCHSYVGDAAGAPPCVVGTARTRGLRVLPWMMALHTTLPAHGTGAATASAAAATAAASGTAHTPSRTHARNQLPPPTMPFLLPFVCAPPCSIVQHVLLLLLLLWRRVLLCRALWGCGVQWLGARLLALRMSLAWAARAFLPRPPAACLQSDRSPLLCCARPRPRGGCRACQAPPLFL
jgi:hypothetical protein